MLFTVFIFINMFAYVINLNFILVVEENAILHPGCCNNQLNLLNEISLIFLTVTTKHEIAKRILVTTNNY